MIKLCYAPNNFAYDSFMSSCNSLWLQMLSTMALPFLVSLLARWILAARSSAEWDCVHRKSLAVVFLAAFLFLQLQDTWIEVWCDAFVKRFSKLLNKQSQQNHHNSLHTLHCLHLFIYCSFILIHLDSFCCYFGPKCATSLRFNALRCRSSICAT